MSIIGAIGGLIGSLFDKSASDKAQETQMEIAERNIALQKEFAQTGIQWKAADAKAAGIHPLYALGATTHSFAPVSVGTPPPTDFANVGQNLGRAIDATRTGDQKASAFDETVRNLTLQKMGLENEVLASQLRTINAGNTPAFPGGSPRLIDGQGNAPIMSGAGGLVTVTVNPANTPAQDAENQYGEIGGEIFGVGNLISDLVKTHYNGRLGDYLGGLAPHKVFAPRPVRRGTTPKTHRLPRKGT